PADAAATTAVVHNDPSGSTDPISNTITGGTFTHATQLEVSDQAAGAAQPVQTNTAGHGNSFIDPTSLKVLQLTSTFSNNTSADIQLNQWMLLPKYYDHKNVLTAPTVDASAFDDTTGLKPENVTGIDVSQLQYAGKDGDALSWAAYKKAGFTPTDLREIKVGGSLEAGLSGTLTVPLALPAADVATNDFSYGELTASAGIGSTLVASTTRFAAKPLTNSDGSSLIPYTGAFLATVKSKDGSAYVTVPSMQQYMPKAENGVNYWVNNYQAAPASGTSEDVLYPGGYYTISTAPLLTAVKDHGYSVGLGTDGKPMTQYSYRSQNTTANIVGPDGKPANNPTGTAPYVELRQVIKGQDASINVGDTFDTAAATKALGLEVFGHDGKDVPLTDKSVTIDLSKVNTAANGTYPVTVTYAPDEVSNTFNVKVGTGTTGGGGGETGNTVTPKAPTQGADQVTIPTIPGVDYQVDGKTVTGTITLNDGQKITVTAKAQDGYTLTEGATATWDFTYNKGTTPTCDTQYFTDVTPNMQFFNDICWLKANNITTGWPDGTYRPVTPINRDAMIAYIYRMAGSPAFTPAGQTFSDVTPSTMYYKEIEWAAHEGITTGWPDGTFRPVTPVARDAMAAFLYRQSGSPAVTLPASPSFSDVPAGNMYYREIEWMQHEGIANGWLDGTFRPLNDTNRDAMAAFLHRAVESGVLTLA
ncbi:S-layer homology domain-containing protein, partial [Propionibacterium freudenreichii]|uniref:S-layer homology domain-containing protein n=1 Tax=Propionibacterium freudenreichii TaxID=1744 RepID=UPI0018C294A7